MLLLLVVSLLLRVSLCLFVVLAQTNKKIKPTKTYKNLQNLQEPARTYTKLQKLTKT